MQVDRLAARSGVQLDRRLLLYGLLAGGLPADAARRWLKSRSVGAT